ncbi:MAG: hypothetical protein HQL94_05720 [Magnetococcales bacterium]|nr:hypothetical protein [Magnetococcales bacterium]MBF0437726.1 hypothetical protein [Magnetococcales bacterium]
MKPYPMISATVALLLTMTFSSSWGAMDIAPSALYLTILGGKIYDDWGRELKKKPPSETHPSYPSGSKKKGMDTWLCHECHGWDYQGKDGAFGDKTSPNYTGITGIRHWVGRDADPVVTLLRGEKHLYTQEMLSDQEIQAIALFVTQGQMEMEKYVQGEQILGNPEKGKDFYQTICYRCHGIDGKKINFGTCKEPEYLGTLARKNPFEVLHKIRNGQPGQDMITMAALPVTTQVDILAYVSRLPEN